MRDYDPVKHAAKILRQPDVSDRDAVCALGHVIQYSKTIEQAREAVGEVGLPAFYMCEFERAITDEVKPLFDPPVKP